MWQTANLSGVFPTFRPVPAGMDKQLFASVCVLFNLHFKTLPKFLETRLGKKINKPQMFLNNWISRTGF